ncbi:hypothetical protein EMCRGX_G002743 [Ephydatia muelleri]
MSGIHNGVQAVMRRDNEAALYSPCACHSLNLCGSHAAQCCSEVITFFGMVQKLYVFFSASPQRWEILQEQLTRYVRNKMVGTRYCSQTSRSHSDSILKSIEAVGELTLTPEATIELTSMQDMSRHCGCGSADLLCDLQSIRDQWIKIWDEPVLVAKGLQMPIKLPKAEMRQVKRKRFLDEGPEQVQQRPQLQQTGDPADEHAEVGEFRINVFYRLIDAVILHGTEHKI